MSRGNGLGGAVVGTQQEFVDPALRVAVHDLGDEVREVGFRMALSAQTSRRANGSPVSRYHGQGKGPYRYFDSSPEVIRPVVKMYVRDPLSLRNVEDLLFE